MFGLKNIFLQLNSLYPKSFILLSSLFLLIYLPVLAGSVIQTQNIRQNAAGSSQFYVYGTGNKDDTLAPGWTADDVTNAPGSFVLTNTFPVFLGTHSIAFSSDNSGNIIHFKPTTPIDISTYYYLNFSFLSTLNDDNLSVYLLDASGKPFPNEVKLKTNNGVPAGNSWKKYSIPITAFGMPGMIGGIMLAQRPESRKATYYIDEIVFDIKP